MAVLDLFISSIKKRSHGFDLGSAYITCGLEDQCTHLTSQRPMACIFVMVLLKGVWSGLMHRVRFIHCGCQLLLTADTSSREQRELHSRAVNYVDAASNALAASMQLERGAAPPSVFRSVGMATGGQMKTTHNRHGCTPITPWQGVLGDQ